jgi:hypothetical protein
VDRPVDAETVNLVMARPAQRRRDCLANSVVIFHHKHARQTPA